MTYKYAVISVFLIFLNACAWKAQDLPGAPPSENKETFQLASENEGKEAKDIKALLPKQLDVLISWEGSTEEGRILNLKRTISEKNDVPKEFYLDRPVTLSAIVPNEVDLDFNISRLSLKPDETILISGKVDSSDLTLKNNPLSVFPDHALIDLVGEESHLKVKVSGIRNVLSDSEQEKAFITLDFRHSKTTLKVASIYFSLITPPKRVLFDQIRLSKLPQGHYLNALDLGVLQSPAKKLELIQVIKSQNRTGEAIVVEMPTRVAGKLWQKRRYFRPQPRIKGLDFLDEELCLDTSDETNRDFVFSENFYILPLSPELRDNWVSILTEDLGTLSIPAGQDKFFGIFADNPQNGTSLKTILKESGLDEYYTHQYRWMPERKTINTKCEFGCGEAQNYSRFFTQCEEIPIDHTEWIDQCKERVAACEACVKLRALGSYSMVWSPICNQCHSLETIEGKNQIFDYHGMRACSSWQMKVLETKQAIWGEVVEPVELSLDRSVIKAFVRFNYSERIIDPEGRHFDVLKDSSSLD
jgi:hypothetical protein